MRLAVSLLALGLYAAVAGAEAPATRGAPIGAAVTAKFQVVGEGASDYGVPTIVQAQFTVLEVLRGAAAWERLQQVDPTNPPPAAGFEYLLARVRIAGTDSGAARIPYPVQADHFRIFDAANQPYPTPAARPPRPALIGQKVYPGDVREGWLMFTIAKDDQRPELFFFSGLWFQL